MKLSAGLGQVIISRRLQRTQSLNKIVDSKMKDTSTASRYAQMEHTSWQENTNVKLRKAVAKETRTETRREREEKAWERRFIT